MHGFEIGENALCERNMLHLAMAEEKASLKVGVIVYKYLKKKRKLLKLKPIARFVRKIKKRARKIRRRLDYIPPSMQTA